MSDDIVTRLREQTLNGIWDFTLASFDMQDAADEIERLRGEVAYLKSPCPRCDYEEPK